MTEPSDRELWDERHARARGEPLRPADAFVLEVLDDLGPGAGRTALDLACGTGRHALALAERGFRVEAWDVSPVGLAVSSERALARGLAVETRLVDLAEELPPVPPVSLVVVVDFLDRALFGRLRQLVRPGGNVVVATFTRDWPDAHPSPRFRLERAELAAGLPGLERVRHVELGGRAGLWARAREES